MLTSIRIQNFRSIRDASVKLGQVNLFIGPNNSGKSNFLKGIEFVARYLDGANYDESVFDKVLTRPLAKLNNNILNNNERFKNLNHIQLNFEFNSDSIYLTPSSEVLIRRGKDIIKANSNKFENEQDYEMFKESSSNEEQYRLTGKTENLLNNILENCFLYKPDPAKFVKPSLLFYTDRISADAENIIPFLFNLSQNHKSFFKSLETSFLECVNNLSEVSTPADINERGMIKLAFFDSSGDSYSADEVSEGVLYFLALLCIIYQPDPPKLLLLEEPEKGIHPRRIREVMNFIFELARLRDIQIILTSHSPYVVDHFADIPECISVFDRENGETVIRNAADLIEQTNKEYAEQGLPPVSYKDSLGEYWLSGFLGGVPV